MLLLEFATAVDAHMVTGQLMVLIDAGCLPGLQYSLMASPDRHWLAISTTDPTSLALVQQAYANFPNAHQVPA